MLNDNGQYYYPEYDVDQIGDFNINEGYQVLIESDNSIDIEISGIPVNPSLPIIIENHKQNMIPYFPQNELAVESVFENYDILLVKNDSGHIYVPNLEDTMGDMMPGEAYYVYINGDEDISFTYPSDVLTRKEYSDKIVNEREGRITKHYPEFKSTGITYPIIITDIIGFVEEGDEFGAYANDDLVGAVRITNLEEPISIITFGSYRDFGFDLSGYNNGDEIVLKLWSNRLNRELDVESKLDHPLYGMSPLAIGSAEVQFIKPNGYNMSEAFPNPFNPITQINYSMPVASQMSIIIYDMQGREVQTLYSGFEEIGYHSVTWNATNHSSGIYFIRMISGEYAKTQKLILVK